MERWSLAAEVLAFILVAMITMFSYEKKQAKSIRKKIFETGLFTAGASMVLNVICVYTIENYDKVPYLINMVLNSAYFFVSTGMSVLVAAYLFDLILEHVYSKQCRTRAVTGLVCLMGAYTLLVVSNFWNRLLFWFDKEGGYHRGILNKTGYGILFIEVIMVAICYWRNRASVGRKVRRVIFTLPSIVVLLGIFQIAYPELLLNGTIITFALLILFVNFQNFQVERDSLTGIGNRKNFYEELFLRLKGKEKFQVVMVSLNEFAMVNQQYGYRRGDELLYHVARWMEDCREEGRAYRFGNVTFALLCPYVNEEDSEYLLSRVEERFHEPWVLGELECNLSASFSTMVCQKSALEATQVVELLSFIVECSKTQEGGVVKLDAETRQMFQKKKNMEHLLRDSIENNRFEVWYQPIFNCKLQKFDSAEALLRLRDYEGDMVSPAEFIPLAEKKGMIEDIGRIVLREVCRFMGSHPGIPLQTVSVNMSAQQFTNPGLYDEMESCLKEFGIDASRVKLEITERAILFDEKYMKQMMNDFSSKGFHFSVDDFGIGYSNFSSVIHLPFEFIKLDRSLIEKLPSNSKDGLVVQSMIEMFHRLGLKVVAEGVETKEQQKAVQNMGADSIQGFYYSRPMPEEEVLSFEKGVTYLCEDSIYYPRTNAFNMKVIR